MSHVVFNNKFSRAFVSRMFLVVALLATIVFAAMMRESWAAVPPAPGGPILVVTSASSPYGDYYAEILRNEGLNEFAVLDASAAINATELAKYDVVVLAKMSLTASQASVLSTWVNGGGNLIAMGPDAQLAPLLGLTPAAGGPLSNAYLGIDTSTRPGNGIVGQTIQYHGSADRYTSNGSTQVATLFSTSTTATVHPAVSLRNAGTGRAAAFTFDLATSIVLTRQGNPAWAAQERDGFLPIRSDDKFFGNAQTDPQSDWVDLSKVSIPQADELQRLFANLILFMNESKKPLPRFWYFPNGKKAVVVMTGDDHGNGGTIPRFEEFKAASPAGCSVQNWECVRGTSYIYESTPMSNALASDYAAQGFEVGLHVNTSCLDFNANSLEDDYVTQIAAWQAKYSGVPAPSTQRHHCIVWSDWTTGAQVQLNHNIRLDTSYYFWPPSWVNNVPGFLTGSAMPMRFSTVSGNLLDVYMAATQMTDESGQTYPFTPNTLLDRAVGEEGYYGAYVINAHTDASTSVEATTTVASAQARGVPVISAQQLLTWVDARNASTFSALQYSGSTLNFTITAAANANGLQAMLPLHAPAGMLTTLTRNGSAVSFSVQGVKGVEYAFFSATGGNYVASYSADVSSPTVTSSSPANGAQSVNVSSNVSVVFSEAMNPDSINGGTFQLTNAGGGVVSSSITYDAANRRATLRPTGLLTGGQNYTVTVRGGTASPRATDVAGNPVAPYTGTFTTAAGVSCPCGVWNDNTAPGNASSGDPNGVEVGVKFTTDVNGYVNGVRFYKGSGNTGTHIGNLWSSTGDRLATATFTNETATGWQQVTFNPPVPVTADTVYVASYYAPAGNYAFDFDFFALNGLDTGPVNLLRDGVSGGNGVYQYGSQSVFPTSTWRSTNYWVDVVFTIDTAPVDTTPPSVSATTPTSSQTGIAVTAAPTVTFNEPMDPATVNTTTVVLRDAANAVVTTAVSYNAATRTATLTPAAPLQAPVTYTVTVAGGASDPRLKDVSGNAMAQPYAWSFTTAAVTGPCVAPANAIVAENCLTGSPQSEWDVSGIGDPSIQGFATQISVNRGSTVFFKVNTNATAYRLDIYRLGYYAGLGARKVATVLPSVNLPQVQQPCLSDSSTGLIDCGNWGVSASWAVPAAATSGIYIARLVRSDNGGASHVVFVVRDDAASSDVLFQTSDTTWQAYNSYGGNSLYTGGPGINPSRAYMVSYNRPFNTRGVDNGQDWLFNAEYPMVRWLEANGYDVSYFSGVDTERFGSLIQNHRAFLSVGHDEYWSGNQRANVEAARNAGVHLAFFSGNEVYWKTRWANSIDGTATPYRTLVSYKETHANAKIDPTSTWTGTWRDPRFSSPPEGGRPENALTGTLFRINDGATTAITVPAADGKMRFWRNTTIATQTAGGIATLPQGTLGYEWDVDEDNTSRPPGLVRLSTTIVNGAPTLLDFGSTYGPATSTHRLTYYRHSSGARVFGAGTVQWSWGLDSVHDRGNLPADARMRQATVNVLADMNVQPATLQSGLVAATASTDTVAPTATITSPAAGASVSSGVSVSVTGTAADTGGGVVGGVEVSVDNGLTWHPANGRETWSYTWTPLVTGSATLRARAVDDSGNLGAQSASVAVTVQARVCPCSLWSDAVTPAVASDSETAAVNLGVKFTSEQAGSITAIRFYKGTANTGTHIGSLWSASGQLLASATFTNESASGWQQVEFSNPVAITANTVYVASYFAPGGRYAIDTQYFADAAHDSAPLHALRDGTSGGNGVYAYAATNTFPTSSYQASNYWVDVVFTGGAPPPPLDTTPPTVSARSPADGATGVSATANVTVTFNEAMTDATIGGSTFELRDASNALVSATVTYNATTRVATLDPSGTLAAGGLYRATVLGGATDPRVKDAAGNAMAANSTWTFTVFGDGTPPTVTGQSPANLATGVSTTANVTATFSEAMTTSTINATTFELRNPANALMTATVTYNATTRVATLDPSATLAAGTVYRATVLGGSTDPRVKDAAGNALAANATWTFTTLADTTPPTVTATVPANNATNVSRTANLTVTFSEPMDAATINSNTIQLRNSGGTLITSVVTYDAVNRIATVNPSSTLSSFNVHTLTIRGAASDPRVKDAAGNAMVTPQTRSFRTAIL